MRIDIEKNEDGCSVASITNGSGEGLEISEFSKHSLSIMVSIGESCIILSREDVRGLLPLISSIAETGKVSLNCREGFSIEFGCGRWVYLQVDSVNEAISYADKWLRDSDYLKNWYIIYDNNNQCVFSKPYIHDEKDIPPIS